MKASDESNVLDGESKTPSIHSVHSDRVRTEHSRHRRRRFIGRLTGIAFAPTIATHSEEFLRPTGSDKREPIANVAWHRVKDSRNARVVERRPRGAPSSPFTLHKQLKHLVFGILSTVKSSPSMSHVSRLPVSKGRERRITMRTVRRDRYASRSPDIDYECR